MIKNLCWVIQYGLLLLLFPLTHFILPLMSQFFRQRILFERKNGSSPSSRSFALDQKKAKIAVEVSSEGELEQVRPLIDFYLEQKELVEIIFSSESVENNILKLQKEFSDLIRIFRLPLLSYFPLVNGRSLESWMTAKTLILCRYDFYPELFLMGLKKNIAFVLVEATLINKMKNIKQKYRPWQFLWEKVFHSFDFIITSTEGDKKDFIRYLKFPSDRIEVGEMRIIQIQKRLVAAFEKLMKYPFWPIFNEFLREKNKKDLILLGNFWDHEASLFDNKNFIQEIKKGKVTCAIVPHVLKEENLSSIYFQLHQIVGENIPIYQLNAVDSEERTRMVMEEMISQPGIIMLNFKGILLELYSFFGHAYVGGGFGRSIHSVLEPYLAMSRVYVGPKVFKSTEFNIAKENSENEIHVLRDQKYFFDEYLKYKNEKIDKTIRKNLVEKTNPVLNKLVEKLKMFDN